jgi:hypothetical protein
MATYAGRPLGIVVGSTGLTSMMVSFDAATSASQLGAMVSNSYVHAPTIQKAPTALEMPGVFSADAANRCAAMRGEHAPQQLQPSHADSREGKIVTRRSDWHTMRTKGSDDDELSPLQQLLAGFNARQAAASAESNEASREQGLLEDIIRGFSDQNIARPIPASLDAMAPSQFHEILFLDFNGGEVRIPSRGVTRMIVAFALYVAGEGLWSQAGFASRFRPYVEQLVNGSERVYADARFLREFITKIGPASPNYAFYAGQLYTKLAEVRFDDSEKTEEEVRAWLNSDYLSFLDVEEEGTHEVQMAKTVDALLELLRKKHPNVVARAGFKRAQSDTNECDSLRTLYGPAFVYAQNYELYRLYEDMSGVNREGEMSGLLNLLTTAGDDRHRAAFASTAMTYYLRTFYGEGDEGGSRSWIRKLIDVALDDACPHVVRAYAQRTLELLRMTITFSYAKPIAPRLQLAVDALEVDGGVRVPTKYDYWISKDLEEAASSYLESLDNEFSGEPVSLAQCMRDFLAYDIDSQPFSARRFAAEHQLKLFLTLDQGDPEIEEAMVAMVDTLAEVCKEVREKVGAIEDEGAGTTLIERYKRAISWVINSRFQTHVLRTRQRQFIDSERAAISSMAIGDTSAQTTFAEEALAVFRDSPTS